MRMLLAGPGTGKTWSTKRLVATEYGDARRVLILSFTNATVHDLVESFADHSQVDCYTLHSYALKINHLTDYYILDNRVEAPYIAKLSSDLSVDFGFLCRQLHCITFDAMITECLSFLKSNPVYAQDQIGALDLLIVDEYQDLNPVERDLVDAIAAYASETIILGDDDQTIYGFKDADPEGIIHLYKRDDVQKIHHDNRCYRCPDSVVTCASNLILHNKNRVDKPWLPTGKAGDCVRQQFRTHVETNEYIAANIERIRNKDLAEGKIPVTSILVLSAMRFYVDDLVMLLRGRGIEVVDFWTQSIDPDDYRRIWWIRAILSKRVILNLIFLSRDLSQHFRRKFRGILATALNASFDEEAVVAEVGNMFDSGLMKHIEETTGPAELAAAVPDLAALLEGVDTMNLSKSLDALMKDANPPKQFDPNAVNVMSIHKSKGLQADVVFVSGLVNGVLPNSDKGLDTIEAQRRLLFVGVTRAREALHLLSTVEWDGSVVHRVDKSQFKYSRQINKWRATTSRFVAEMD